MTIRMLLTEDTILGKRNNFTAVNDSKAQSFIDNQLKIQERMHVLFDNVNASDRFVFEGTAPLLLNHNSPYNLSTVSTGLVSVAMNNSDFLDNGSDFVDLHIIKEAYKAFDNNVMLTEKAHELLNAHNIKIEQLNAFDTDDLFEHLDANKRNISIGHVTQKTNTVILHAMPYSRPEANSPLAGNINFAQQVEILRSVNPEICCSSFNKDQKHRGDDFGYAIFGAIISSGDIIHAGGGDCGSQVNDEGKRVLGKYGQMENTQEHIEEIVKNRSTSSMNEIIVKNPDIAGVYLNLDSLTKGQENSPDKSIASAISPLSLLHKFKELNQMSKHSDKPLPMFIIFNGEVREAKMVKSFMQNYLPYGKDVPAGVNILNLDLDSKEMKDVNRDYENKLSAWKELGDTRILNSAFELSEPLTQNDLLHMGVNNRLKTSDKIELIEKNAHVMKGNISEFKLDSLREIEKKEISFMGSLPKINTPILNEKKINNKLTA